MPKKRGGRRGKTPQFFQLAVLLFGIGVIAGAFLAKGIHSSYPTEINQFFEQVGRNLENGEKEATDLFQTVLGKHLKGMGLLLLFSISFLGLPYIGGFLLYKGGVFGFLIGSVLLQFGTKGSLLAITLLFPQSFLYVPAYYSILCRGYHLGLEDSSQREIKKQLPAVFTALALLLVGCILEAYGNVWILERVFPIM